MTRPVSPNVVYKLPRTGWTPQTRHSPLQSATFLSAIASASSAVLRRALPAAPPYLRPSQPAQSSATTSSTSMSTSFPYPRTGEAALSTPSLAPPRRSSQRSPTTWPDLSGSLPAMILLPIASSCITLARPQPLLSRHCLSSPAYRRAAPPLRHSRRRAP